MLSAPLTGMTETEFAAFLQARDERWELLDGAPIMMVRTTQRHRDLVANILASLHGQLRGTRCRATCARTGVRTGVGTIRHPDLVVDRGPRDDHGMCATSPALVCEVLSPAHDPFDTHLRVSEYRSVPDIACVLLIDPNAPRAILHWRGDAWWHDSLYDGLDQIVEFPGIGTAVPLRDIYDGLEFGCPDDNLGGRSC